MRRLAIACLALAAACSGANPYDLTGPLAGNQPLALAQARAKWADAGIHDYGFDITVTGAWFGDALHVEVRADTVLSATSYRTGSATGFKATMPQLYADIARGIENGAAVQVLYEARTGYPARISVPNPPNWADADWGATVEHFVRR